MPYYTMKQKLSITLDEELLKLIDKLVETGKFRNKSHFVEYSLNSVIKQEKDKLNEVIEGGKND